jgi:predicted nucleic acid-binding protein
VTDIVLDASLALQWFLEDEADRKYALGILASLSDKRAFVPILWFYEVGNGLLMAYRRKRVSLPQVAAFLTRLKALPIEPKEAVPAEILELPALAQARNLTNYDAAYLSLAMRLNLPLATTDLALRQAAVESGLAIAVP